MCLRHWQFLLKFCHSIKKPKLNQKAKHFFQGQTIELFGLKKAKLPTLEPSGFASKWLPFQTAKRHVTNVSYKRKKNSRKCLRFVLERK